MTRLKHPSCLVVSTRSYRKSLPCSERKQVFQRNVSYAVEQLNLAVLLQCTVQVERFARSVLPAWWFPHAPLKASALFRKREGITVERLYTAEPLNPVVLLQYTAEGERLAQSVLLPGGPPCLCCRPLPLLRRKRNSCGTCLDRSVFLLPKVPSRPG